MWQNYCLLLSSTSEHTKSCAAAASAQLLCVCEREGALERSVQGRRGCWLLPLGAVSWHHSETLSCWLIHEHRDCRQGEYLTSQGSPGWFSTMCRSKELPLPVPRLAKPSHITEIEFLDQLSLHSGLFPCFYSWPNFIASFSSTTAAAATALATAGSSLKRCLIYPPHPPCPRQPEAGALPLCPLQPH